MSRRDLPSIFTAAFLSFLLSFGGIQCLSSAYTIDISTTALILYSCAFTLTGCILFTQPKGGRWLLCGLVVLAVYLWRRTKPINQILQLCYQISRIIGTAYGFGWLGRPMGVDSVALPLYLWAGINGLLCSWCITRRRLISVSIFFSLIPLALCLILTNTIPSLGGLFCLLLGLILLLLTHSAGRQDHVRLTRILSGPVALALALLFLLNPQATYDKQHYADRMGDTLLRAVDRIPYVDIRSDGSVNFSLVRHIPDFVDLQYKGSNNQLPIPVMEVTAESSGILYLRGRDYDTYNGTQWTASRQRNETFTNFHTGTYSVQPRTMGSLTVKTSGSRSSRYLPYYPDKSYPLEDGACTNPHSESVYTYNWYALLDDFDITLFTQDNVWSRTYDIYLQLPEDTRHWATTYLAENLPSISSPTTVHALAETIAAHVRGTAAYDLNTPRMPDSAEDFARWFMEDSDTGYCVHYATATTVLLRAAGIPARYVEGYLAETVAGQTVTVTEKDAHAWAEYYIAGIGWIPLESTAANIAEGPTPLRPTEQTTAPTEQTTNPTVTEAPTEPSTDTTAPSNISEASITPPSSTSGGRTDDTTPSAQPVPGQKKSFTVSKPVFITVCLLFALLAQYPARLRIRETYLNTGDPNTRAIKHWRFACRLARLMGQPLPENLQELALRAKFSQHKLTETDLLPFKLYGDEAIRHLRRRPWWQKVYHRLFWAAY